jgi:hypothetical protein
VYDFNGADQNGPGGYPVNVVDGRQSGHPDALRNRSRRPAAIRLPGRSCR